jgi:exopolysaccharide production protein ExoQ
MPNWLATTVYVGIMLWLFRRDIRQKPNVTSALWIPLIWMLIIMTRFVSSWLDIFGIHIGSTSVAEGSPVDALGSGILIIAGLRVLYLRGVRLGEIVRQNRWLTIFFIYCFLAVLWSDFPFIAFKRWIKILGQPITVLVLFTEPDFETALATLMKRCAYVVVVISVLFIKYFPELGRGFSQWTGQGFNTGITLDKNALGADCLILGFFFVWYVLRVLNWEKSVYRRNELVLSGVFLCLIWWLFHEAQSSTSLVSCILGISVMLFLGLRAVRKENIGTYLIAAVAIAGIAEYLFNVSDVFLDLLGKDRTLTDRTKVWADCLNIPINPIIGVGFESFWLGKRQEIMNEKWSFHPNEAHNGYLETYLNLGLIGLFILLALLLATFWKARRELLASFHLGRFRVSFLFAVLVYNWTEASFKALHPVWFVFYIIALDYPKPQQNLAPQPAESIYDPAETSGHGASDGDEDNKNFGFAVPR